MTWYVWVILGVVLLVLEIFTASFFVSLIGVAALIMAPLSLFVNHLWLQLLLFAFLSVTIVWLFLPVIRKSMNQKVIPTNQDAMIGKTVRVTEEINNHVGTGYVKYYGDMFPAKSLHNTVIPIGREVVIRRIEGIRVFVEEVEEK